MPTQQEVVVTVTVKWYRLTSVPLTGGGGGSVSYRSTGGTGGGTSPILTEGRSPTFD